MFHGRMLLAPDANPSGGTAPAEPVQAGASTGQVAQPASPSPVSAVSTPPAGQRTITDQEYQSLQAHKGKAQSWDGLHNRLRQEAGVQSVDDALSKLGRFKTIESDPMLKGIVEHLLAPQQPTGASPSTSIEQSFDLAKLPQIVQEQVKGVFDARDKEAFERQWQSEAKIENDLVNSTATDPRFKAFFGDKSFDDNYTGKGSKPGRLIATMLDAELASLADKYPDGRTRPITDQAKINQAKENVWSAIQELRAATLLDLSGPSMPGLEPPKGTTPVQPQPRLSNGVDDPWPTHEQVQATVERQRAMLAGV